MICVHDGIVLMVTTAYAVIVRVAGRFRRPATKSSLREGADPAPRSLPGRAAGTPGQLSLARTNAFGLTAARRRIQTKSREAFIA
jgi:hypothetical protein